MAGGEKALHQARAERRGAPARAGLIPHPARRLAVLALFGWGATLLVFWPGVALYDSLDQYGQVVSGAFEDWHPPVMARLWSLFAAWWPGGAPMFVLQTGLYWLGIGLLAAACGGRLGSRAGLGVLAAGAFFLASCWLAAVLKDAQMVGAMVAAAGIVALYRFRDRPLPAAAAAAAGLLLLYALLLRANAPFGVVPLALLLFRIGRGRAPAVRPVAAVAGILVALALAPIVNHRLLGAEPSGAEKSLFVYDLQGIGSRVGGEVAGIPHAAWSPARCYSVVQWDPAGEEGCPGYALTQAPGARVARLWATALLHHPFAYAAHRLAHFDTTMRWIVPPGLPHAVGPVDPEPNALGLGAPASLAARAVHDLGGRLAPLPPAWPIFWLALGLVLLRAAATAPAGGPAEIALALTASAVAMDAAYVAVSVASDLRYHLWTMVATALALVILAGSGALGRRDWAALLAAALGVGAAGIAARLLLPPFA